MLNLQTFNCAGCSACANKCPVGAIKMCQNEEGFYIPFIDESKCTNCRLCEKVCPENNLVEKNTKTPNCYAVMADDEIREKSSSGGAFSVIAHEIFVRGGVVCGAAFDENWKVEHIIIDREDDMDKLRGSKYVQSFISKDLYKKLKKYLDDDRYVLFSGTPCQVAGLKSFLDKEYEKLLLVDIICSKVPPAKLFNKFLNDNYEYEKISDIKFRDKNNGWNCSTTTITVDGEEKKSRTWFRMYLNSLSMNESCVHCKYMSSNRVSDITIGDFWGIEKVYPELNDKKGTSCVLINTKKAQLIFNSLNWQKKELLTIQNAINGNRALCVPFIPNLNRFSFANKINKNTENFDTIVEDCLSIKKNVGILNWWWNSNRGAILTCYAIQEVVKELGFNPFVIKHIPFDYYNKEYKNSISEQFATKYFNLTEWCHSRVDMRKLNDKFSTFMVGSDQVWRHGLNWFLQDFYYLNFANIKKNLISCAASFGASLFSGNDTVISMVKYYFKRFNHISVREEDAVTLLNNVFNSQGTFILDPVFLIDKNKYIEIANTSNLKNEEAFVAYYFIHTNKNKELILQEICKKLNLKAINIKKDGLNIEHWLYYIKNSKFIVSDSFHASAFSIIFNKNFITVYDYKEDSRFITLSKITGLINRFKLDFEFSINDLQELLKDENWEDIETKLQAYKSFSLNWLKNALETPYSKEISEEQEYIEAFYSSFDDRINYLEGKCIELDSLKTKIDKLELLNRKNYIYLNYYKYKILKNIFKKKSIWKRLYTTMKKLEC